MSRYDSDGDTAMGGATVGHGRGGADERIGGRERGGDPTTTLKRRGAMPTARLMGEIEEIYADLETDVSEEEFREAVEEKVEQMGGLADEETAAMLIAHELNEGEVDTVADIEPGMEEVKFLAKVVSIGELRTFERDGEDGAGLVGRLDVDDAAVLVLAVALERA